PGIRRGRLKTTSDAISSDGSATSTRRARYRRSTRSALQPGGEKPAAVIVAEIGAVVLKRAVPHRDVDAGIRRDVVLLPGEVPLDLRDQLLALGDVEVAALAHEHVGEHGIVDVALVPRLLGVELAVEKAVGLEERRLWPVGHRREVAVEARRDIGAV